MSIIPPPLGRRSSTWSILRSLDTLSPPPSWSSLDNLTACGQVGSIPLILHEGIGDLPNLTDGSCSDGERHESSPMDPLDREYKAGALLDNNAAVRSCIPPKQSSASPCTKPYEATESITQAEAVLFSHPQRTHQCTPESSLEKARRISHNDIFYAAAETSPSPCNRLSVSQATAPGSFARRTATGSECQEPSEHKHKGSTSTPDSVLSSRSNLSSTARDVNRITLEKASTSSVRFPLLPVALSWLQSTTLEIMIDQEGFRMIKPVFRFAGYSWPTTMESDSLSPDVRLVTSTADFMPLQRKSFAFHHSALDTPPVLRRLMVNGDRSYDYLSRQAYLILKANGPYTVQGIEPMQSSRLFPTSEPPVLAWRFDYFIADRRTEAGRIIPGEKTLTPLSFTCSPALLQPTQAKKIRVVHIVKKGVAVKLTAKKMEPPTPPSPYLVREATLLSNAESELCEAATRNLYPNVLQDTSAVSISIHDSAQLSSSIIKLHHHHGTGGAFSPIPDSP
jgi:hypothetical protein